VAALSAPLLSLPILDQKRALAVFIVARVFH
jgi:hypothetical protein